MHSTVVEMHRTEGTKPSIFTVYMGMGIGISGDCKADLLTVQLLIPGIGEDRNSGTATISPHTFCTAITMLTLEQHTRTRLL